MRILYVTQVVLDRPHGGPRHVLSVVRHLREQGHEVLLLAPGHDTPLPGVQRMRPPSALQPGVRMESVLAARAAEAVVRWRPDVAYVRLSASSSFIPLALWALRVPVVVELNGRLIEELRKLGRSPTAVAVVRFNLRRVVERVHTLVAVEPKIGRHATEVLNAPRVVVIENGADVDAATPGPRAEARARLGLAPPGPLLTFAGTLVPELRLDLLFEVMADRPDLSLVLAGDGPQRDRVAAAAAGPFGRRLRWLGAVPHATAVDCLRAADVCVNVRDGDLGMKSFEYAAVGRRFVNFDVEGVERLTTLFPGHEAVHLVRERTKEGLLRAITGALDAERSRGPLPAPAVEAVRGRVGWGHTARRIAELLASVRA